jgi:hypothetical protein
MGGGQRSEAALELHEAAREAEQPSSGPESREMVRPPRILLAGFDAGDEPTELALDRCFVEVVRVPHCLVACMRIRELRPKVVIVAPRVQPLDFMLLRRAAREIDAAILQLGSPIVRHVLVNWLSEQLSGPRPRKGG